MSRPRRLATLVASLALHAAALLAVVLFVTRESELGALYIDLTRGADTEGGGAIAAGGGAPSAAAGGAPRAVARTARASGALEALAPRHAPPVALEPSPPRASATEPAGNGAVPGAPGGAGAVAAGSGVTSAGAGAPGGVGVRGRGIGTAPDVSRGLALAGPGTGGGAPGAEYGSYLTRLRERIQEALRYPPAARRRGLQGTVALEIVIRPDGTFGLVGLADSSSHALLDAAALETVRRLAPEPFPPGVPPRHLRVRLPVVFTLE
ncbi:MAG TPA: energy transducer TonB [Methylomirabilota bacterium]|nr:energy transducer TonB [Methylomirabilota bacterium]